MHKASMSTHLQALPASPGWTLEDGAETTVGDLHRGAIVSPDLTGLKVINRHLKKYKATAQIATASSICGNPKGAKAKKPATLQKHECTVKDDEGKEPAVSLEETDVLVLNARGAPAGDAVLRKTFGWNEIRAFVSLPSPGTCLLM